MKLTESQLKNIVKTAALKVLKEEVDELSPELLKHSADKRGEQLKGLGRASKFEPENITNDREKFRAQRDNFKKGAADALEGEIADPRIHVHSDLRTMDATEGPYQIHHRPGMDLDNPKVYDNSIGDDFLGKEFKKASDNSWRDKGKFINTGKSNMINLGEPEGDTVTPDSFNDITARDVFGDYDNTIKPSFERFNKLHGINEEKINEIVTNVINEMFKK